MRQVKKFSQIIRSVSLLWMGSLGTAGLALVIQIVLARNLGLDGYGQISAALATIAIISPFAGFGASSFMLKIFGAEGWMALRWIRPISFYVGVTSFGAIAAVFCWAEMVEKNRQNADLLLILIPVILGQAGVAIVSSKLQLEERYVHLSLWQPAANATRLLVVFFLFLFLGNEASAISVAWGISFSMVPFILLSILSIKRLNEEVFRLKGHPVRGASQANEIAPAKMAGVAKDSWLFGISGVLYLVYYQSDIVLLGYLSGPAAAGAYNAAYLIIGATYLFPGVVFQKYLLPKLHRWTANDFGRIQGVYRKGTIWMSLVGVVGAVVVAGAAQFIVPILFGSKFAGAVSLVMILAICIPIRFFSSAADAVLTSGRQLNRKIIIQAVVAFLNCVINVALIPRFGVWAAVYSTIFSEVLMAIALHFAVKKYFSNRVLFSAS